MQTIAYGQIHYSADEWIIRSKRISSCWFLREEWATAIPEKPRYDTWLEP